MNIMERGKAFLQSLRELASKTTWDWRRCPSCGEMLTCKWSTSTRHPWTVAGRQPVRVQRHRYARCSQAQGHSVMYSEQSPWLVRGSWYAREVHRFTLDHLQHVGSSVRRTAELVRSLLGKQERWRRWRPLDPVPADAAACHLRVGTVQRWVDQAGDAARRSTAYGGCRGSSPGCPPPARWPPTGGGRGGGGTPPACGWGWWIGARACGGRR